MRVFCSAATVAVAQVILCSPAFADEKKPVKAIKEWAGSVADDNAGAGGPKIITEAKELEKLWTDWKLEGKPPEVDFTKEFIAVVTSRGSKISHFVKADEKTGSLTINGLGTRDLRPGTRYVIGSYSREGIKMVNGKELK